MNNEIDFDLLFENSDDSTETLSIAGTIEELGFTKDQIRFINLLIVRSLKKYHEQLFL